MFRREIRINMLSCPAAVAQLLCTRLRTAVPVFEPRHGASISMKMERLGAHVLYNVSARKDPQVAQIIPETCTTTSFVEAAQYGRSNRFVAAVIIQEGTLQNSLTIINSTLGKAEQTAIALALLDGKRPKIYTDSRPALKAFACGTILEEAFNLLDKKRIAPHTITWLPAHHEAPLESLPNLNEAAHTQARALIYRAGFTADS